MAKYLTSVYVSGWQCSSTASTSNEPGPDVADYPYDTVPNKAKVPLYCNPLKRSKYLVESVILGFTRAGHDRRLLCKSFFRHLCRHSRGISIPGSLLIRWISSSEPSSSTIASSMRSDVACSQMSAPRLQWLMLGGIVGVVAAQ